LYKYTLPVISRGWKKIPSGIFHTNNPCIFSEALLFGIGSTEPNNNGTAGCDQRNRKTIPHKLHISFASQDV